LGIWVSDSVCVIVPSAVIPSAIFPPRPVFFPGVAAVFERVFLAGFATGVDVAEGDN